MTFAQTSAVELSMFLPNLPPSTLATTSDNDASHSSPVVPSPTPLDLIHRLLVYPPPRRSNADEALNHPWFEGVLLPAGYPVERNGQEILMTLESRTVGDLLRSCLPQNISLPSNE